MQVSIIIIIVLVTVFIALWLLSDLQKRKFDAEQARLREDRKVNLENLKAEQARKNKPSKEE